MTEIPRAVLSEHFQERMNGKRLRSAVFLTYLFDPGFFEQEVLPVFLDIPLSHATSIRLMQLEDALQALPGQVAVYYDANGLVTGDSGSAKLDIRRVPVQHKAIFHPKNIFLLVEDEEADETGAHPKSLIIASLSANLTRAGWWENVESCHVEEITEGEKTRLKDDVTGFLEKLRRKVPAERENLALRDVVSFLRRADQSLQKSFGGRLYTHFYAGGESFVDFLKQTAGNLIRGAYLEVISPYFDDTPKCAPIATLIEEFQPKEVRVHLPRSASGEALCRQELYDFVRSLPGVQWGRMPEKAVRLGTGKEAAERFVHAKVYRFFTQNPKREVCFVGSPNLTSPAHQSGGNVETGFLLDMVPPHRPDFWLLPDRRKPTDYQVRTEDEAAAASGGTSLNVRYHWGRAQAEAFWDAPGVSPTLQLEGRGVIIGSIGPLSSREWVGMTAEISQRIGNILSETSLLIVISDGDQRAQLLVQEEGMFRKPSLLLQLSAADILRYWSLLTPAQRTAFLEVRAPDVAVIGQGADLVTRVKQSFEADTIFDRFAGFFHGFGSLERTVRSALVTKNFKEATYRLFGNKYDSLGSLLDRVTSERSQLDVVDRYVIVLCARQLCREIESDYPEYWKEHSVDVRSLHQQFEGVSDLRAQLISVNDPGFADFLDWFERRFLVRAEPVEVGT